MCKNKGHLFIHDKHNNIKIQKGNSEPKKKKGRRDTLNLHLETCEDMAVWKNKIKKID